MKSIVFIQHLMSHQNMLVREVAREMAEKGNRVLVINDQPAHGNTDFLESYLIGKCDLEKIITQADNGFCTMNWCSVISCSATPELTQEEKRKMRTKLRSLNNELSARYDVVLWDLVDFGGLRDIVIAQSDRCLFTYEPYRYSATHILAFALLALKLEIKKNVKINPGVVYNFQSGEEPKECRKHRKGDLAWLTYATVSTAYWMFDGVDKSMEYNADFFADVENLAAKLLK